MSKVGIREQQAKVFWDKGFGKVIGFTAFKKYLQTIPKLPKRPKGLPDHYRLVLVDMRIILIAPWKNGIDKVCALLGATCNGLFVLYEYQQEPRGAVYWMWCQNGMHNQGASPEQVKEQLFAADEVGLSATEGLALIAQDPGAIAGERILKLLGSTHESLPGYCAYIDITDGSPWLGLHSVNPEDPDPGLCCASRLQI